MNETCSKCGEDCGVVLHITEDYKPKCMSCYSKEMIDEMNEKIG